MAPTIPAAALSADERPGYASGIWPMSYRSGGPRIAMLTAASHGHSSGNSGGGGAVRRTEKAEALAEAIAAAREDAYSRLRRGDRNVTSLLAVPSLPTPSLPGTPSAQETDAATATRRMLHSLAEEARDPNAAPEELARLAAEARRYAPRREANPVYDALAANPNTPPELLAFLMPLCPESLASNPVLPLLLLEMPDFTARVSRRDRLELLRNGDLPAPLVRLLRTDADPDVADAAALHVSAQNGDSSDLRDYLTRRLTARPEETEPLAEMHAAGLLPTWLSATPSPTTDHRPLTTDHRPLTTAIIHLAAATLTGSPLTGPSKGDGRRPLTGVARYLALRVPAARPFLPDGAASDPDFLVRLAVVENPAPLRQRDLLCLSRDGNRFVRAAAQARLKSSRNAGSRG